MFSNSPISNKSESNGELSACTYFLPTFHTLGNHYMYICMGVYMQNYKCRIIYKVLTSITYTDFESMKMSYSAKKNKEDPPPLNIHICIYCTHTHRI